MSPRERGRWAGAREGEAHHARRRLPRAERREQTRGFRARGPLLLRRPRRVRATGTQARPPPGRRASISPATPGPRAATPSRPPGRARGRRAVPADRFRFSAARRRVRPGSPPPAVAGASFQKLGRPREAVAAAPRRSAPPMEGSHTPPSPGCAARRGAVREALARQAGPRERGDGHGCAPGQLEGSKSSIGSCFLRRGRRRRSPWRPSGRVRSDGQSRSAEARAWRRHAHQLRSSLSPDNRDASFRDDSALASAEP